MAERSELAARTELPAEMMLEVSDTYRGIAEKITGRPLPQSDNPKAEIVELLSSRYGLIR